MTHTRLASITNCPDGSYDNRDNGNATTSLEGCTKRSGRIRLRSDPKEKNTGAQPSGKYGGAAACKAVPRHQLRHNKVLSSRQLSYCLRPGTVSRVTNAPLSIALQAIPLTRQVTTASLSIAITSLR